MNHFSREKFSEVVERERAAAGRRAAMRALGGLATFQGTVDDFIASFKDGGCWDLVGSLQMSDFVAAVSGAVAPRAEPAPAPAAHKPYAPKVPREEVERRIREALGVSGLRYTTDEVAKVTGLGPRQVRPVLIQLAERSDFLGRQGKNRDTVWTT